MGIGNGCYGSVTDGDAGKVLGQQHAAFDMDMAVNKAGKDVGQIVVRAVGGKDGRDASVGNDQRSVADPAIQRIDNVTGDLKGMVHLGVCSSVSVVNLQY